MSDPATELAPPIDGQLPSRPDVLSQEGLERYAQRIDEWVGFLATELSRNEQRLGVALYAIREERLYEVLGFGTFDAYRASRNISKSSAYRYLDQANTYLLPERPPATPAQVEQMGLVKSIVIAPHVRGKTPEEAAELVEDAIHLPESELRLLLEERRGEAPDELHLVLRGIRSQIRTFLARLDIDRPEAVLADLSLEALRWRDQVARARG